MMIERFPLGETSMMSRSSGTAWVTVWSLTLTSVTTPTSPATVTLDGYDAAGPLSSTAIAPPPTVPEPCPMVTLPGWL